MYAYTPLSNFISSLYMYICLECLCVYIVFAVFLQFDSCVFLVLSAY